MADTNTGLMATYDAGESVVMVNGKELWGFGEDTMWTASYDQDSVTVTTDPQGKSVASKNYKTMATLTFNLSESSPCNRIMDELTNISVSMGGFPVDIVDSTTHVMAQHCFIARKPESQGGAAAGNRAWQVKALNMTTESIA